MPAIRTVLLAFTFLCCSILLLHVSSMAAEVAARRFFLAGDGRLHVRNTADGRSVEVNLLNPDGTINEDARNTIDSLFKFVPEGKMEHFSLRLLFMLDYFSDKVAPGKAIQVLSGYRSPVYNESLKKSGGNVAKTSLHMDAMAVDFFIEGVNGKYLWETIRKENCCGVGHYGGRSVHLDVGRPRFWEAATSGVQTGQSDYNRRIYLSTEYDRYVTGEKITSSLLSISDFGFGIATDAALVSDPEGERKVTSLSIQADSGGTCIAIKDRKDARLVLGPLPPNLSPGRYRLRLEFCQVPYKEMPAAVVSNEIKIDGQR
jgi:uncharacterized protein YcbK (DUF882 family)